MSQKYENLLNLALETPLATREKTDNLNVGFDEQQGTWEVIVKYHGSLEVLEKNRIGVEYYSWRSKESAEGAQVDLLLERADRIINLCEMKYSKGLYTLDKDEDLNMRTRMEDFTRETDTKYGVMPILVSTYGLKRNMYSGGIQQQVTMEDLFKEGE